MGRWKLLRVTFSCSSGLYWYSDVTIRHAREFGCRHIDTDLGLFVYEFIYLIIDIILLAANLEKLPEYLRDTMDWFMG